MALLDTTVLIDLGRRKTNPMHQRARAEVGRLLADGQTFFTSRINEAEFRVGPEMSPDRRTELEKVERVLARLMILEFDAAAAARYAVIKAATYKRGRSVGDCDTLIASVALANGQSLITRNTKHFDEIPGLSLVSY